MGYAPENTIASIETALNLGTDCIEVDVYCIEGHLLVFHDPRLDRTTNGFGFIWDYSFAELRTLDAGNGEQIPTLDEVCCAISGRAGLNIELKGPNTAQPALELIHRHVASGWDKRLFLVSSFDHQALVQARALDPDVQIGILTSAVSSEILTLAAKLDAYAVHPALNSVTRQWLQAAHAMGLKVFVYTVNQPEELSRMCELGVDGVFTNFPDRVIHGHRLRKNVGWP